MYKIIESYQYMDNRKISLIQITARTYKIVVESATVHSVSGIDFVHCLYRRTVQGSAQSKLTFDYLKGHFNVHATI